MYPEVLLSIRLPQEEMLLGETTTYCSESFLTEIDSLARKERGEVSFFINGNPDDWDIAAITVNMINELNEKISSSIAEFNNMTEYVSQLEHYKAQHLKTLECERNPINGEKSDVSERINNHH